ncbi:hypothetical protein E4U43_001581 [Claviceps pusilla]|uniref:Uncharacterized protein n=1 Tax=Claviceps pusilla TaxID=123648 RepID=A0A9P7N8R3_9HYPO|nr:hypothetical protein E4U43_001581 [Claviceps pusilla]
MSLADGYHLWLEITGISQITMSKLASNKRAVLPRWTSLVTYYDCLAANATKTVGAVAGAPPRL